MRFCALSVFALCGFLAASPSEAAVITTADLVSVTAAGGGTFDFSVGGWDGGGLVTGSFTGTDTDGDGQLSAFDGEVSAFGMSYSGGTIVGAFALGLGDLFGLVYDLDGGPLGDGLALDIEGIGATSAPISFLIGPGPVGVCGTGADCGIIDAPAAVPEPATLALVLVGSGWLAARRRRR